MAVLSRVFVVGVRTLVIMTGDEQRPSSRVTNSFQGEEPRRRSATHQEVKAPSRGSQSRRSNHLAALPGVVIGAVLAVAVIAFQAFHTGKQAPDSTPGSNDARLSEAGQVDPRVDVAAKVEAMLNVRSSAVMSKDSGRWVSALDGSDVDFVQHQDVVFQRLSAIPFSHWSYEIRGTDVIRPVSRKRLSELNSTAAWVVPTILEYSIGDGAKSSPVRRPRAFTVVQRGTDWLITSTADGDTSVEPWDVFDVNVVQTDRSLVLGSAATKQLKRIAADADRASERVDKVWGTKWPRVSMLVVPDTQKSMAQILGRATEDGLDQVAAVTTGVVAAGDNEGVTSGDRVVVNPAGYKELGSTGRNIVLTHELTHVATRVVTKVGVPIWLSEGFADYVAYSGSGVKDRFIKEAAVTKHRRNTVNAELPRRVDFDPTKGDIGPAYAGSWLAVNILAQRAGDEALAAAYRDIASASSRQNAEDSSPLGAPGGDDTRQVASDQAVEAALVEHTGTTLAELTALWRKELSRP